MSKAIAKRMRSLATSQARTALPSLVSELRTVEKPGNNLADHAVEVGPRNRGGVWMVPACDAEAAIAREERLRHRLAQSEDEAENLAIALFLMERIDRSEGEAISGADFIRELGFVQLADDLPG